MGSITHSDIAQALQSALEQAQSSSQDNEIDYSLGITLLELTEFLDVPHSTARRMLRQAIRIGTIEANGRQVRRSMANERCRVVVYRVKVKAKE